MFEIGITRWWPPLPSAMNNDRSGTWTSPRRNPRTSQRRRPPNTIACTIARSRCVRNAPTSAVTSPGDRILGSGRGTRTNGTWRRFPPRRRVDNPRGTGFAATGVSPRAIRYAYNPEIDDNRRAIVRADKPDSRSEMRTTVRSPR